MGSSRQGPLLLQRILRLWVPRAPFVLEDTPMNQILLDTGEHEMKGKAEFVAVFVYGP